MLLLLLPPRLSCCRYGTAKNYDFSNPHYMESSYPFTQIVWRSTFAAGCAAQTCSNGIVGTLVICRWALLQHSTPHRQQQQMSSCLLPCRNIRLHHYCQ
jgi:hypothetical protein